MKAVKNVSEAIVSIFKSVGIDTCFGVPGGQTLPFYGVARATNFNHIMMRDERNCACAADAYSRISGKIGVCDATVGPGVTNLVSGLAEAYASSVPVIALIADIETPLEHLRHRSVAAQALEQRPLLESITKWIGRVQKAEMLGDIVAHAFRVAVGGRPGPVAIEIPEDIWLSPVPNLDLTRFDSGDVTWPKFRSLAHPELIRKAVSSITTAERPIVLAGGGALSSGAYEEVRAFTELGIPVVSSMNAKGIIDEHLPLALGVVGQFGNVNASYTLQQADVVLILGSKSTQFNSFKWRLPNQNQHVIQIDIDAEELGRSIPIRQGIVADAKEAAKQILEGIHHTRRQYDWQVQGNPPIQPGTSANDPAVAPEKVISLINDIFDEDTILVCDASLSSGWAASRYKVRGHGRKFVAPRGLAGLGWACGASIGAALASLKHTRIVIVSGDGAAAYWLGELETAVRFRLPITVVILNNSSFGWIVQEERSRGFSEESTFSSVDFAMIGEAQGTGGLRAHTIDEVREGLKKAVDYEGPFVLDVLSSEQSTVTVKYEQIDAHAETVTGAYSS